MEQDAQTLDSALAALQQRFGTRLSGPMDHTQAQMRAVLSEQMGVDDLQADRIVKKLTEVGRLRYGGAGLEADVAVPTGTGPVISMPGTTTAQSGEQIVVAPPMITSSGAVPAAATQVRPLPAAVEATERPAVGPAAAEDREGATMGQLGDTNVAASSTPIEAEAAGTLDDSGGYWQIG